MTTKSKQKPTIVCLCGSTRFWEAFRDHGLRLTLEGKIVLSIGIAAPDSQVFAHASDAEGIEIKRRLDELHRAKIDLADEIFVLNVGGYVGDSTRNEIAWAVYKHRPIRFLEPTLGEAMLAEDSHDFGKRIAALTVRP